MGSRQIREQKGMIKNIIFDIGNVLAGFVWQEFYQSFGFPEETLCRLAAATVEGPLWQELDQGSRTTEEVIQGFKERDPSIAKEIDLVFGNVGGMVVKYEYAEAWIGELKERGFSVYLISNISEKILTDCQDALGFLDMVDGGIFSYQVNLQKPDGAIYQLFLERFGCDPEECIFLDDQEPNILAAGQQGIQGIVFRDYSQGRKELEERIS